MTPAQAAAARRLASDPSGPSGALAARAPASRPQRSEAPAPLRVVPAPQRRALYRRRRIVTLLACLLVVASLLAVVVGHSMLAQGQVRLTSLQAQLSAAQARHDAEQLKVAQLQTPGRITGVAEGQHLAAPTQVQQLPSVPLSQPVTPHLAPSSSTASSAAGK